MQEETVKPVWVLKDGEWFDLKSKTFAKETPTIEFFPYECVCQNAMDCAFKCIHHSKHICNSMCFTKCPYMKNGTLSKDTGYCINTDKVPAGNLEKISNPL